MRAGPLGRLAYLAAAIKLIDRFDPVVDVHFFVDVIDVFAHGLLAYK